jgi:hypothetical protein
VQYYFHNYVVINDLKLEEATADTQPLQEPIAVPVSFRMAHRAPRTELTSKDLESMFTKEFVDYLREGLPPGGCVYLKGSTAAFLTGGKLGPTSLTGDRHEQRSSDIDMYSQNEKVHESLVRAAHKLEGGYRETPDNYTGTYKFKLSNGVPVDLNDGAKTVGSLTKTVTTLIAQGEALGSHEADYSGIMRAVASHLSTMLQETDITPFDPKHRLALNGFMPLEATLIQVQKLPHGALEVSVLDPFNIIGSNHVLEQAEAQAQQGMAYGQVFSVESLEYSPFYVALYFEYMKASNERVYLEDKTICVDLYANLLKMAREHVEGNIDIVDPQLLNAVADLSMLPTPPLGPESPILLAAESLGFENLTIRPKSDVEYDEVLQKLRKRAHLEFARACASDTFEAINTFFMDYPFGGLIYPSFREQHYLQGKSPEDEIEIGTRNGHFRDRLAYLRETFYPPKSVSAITTIYPFSTPSMAFNIEQGTSDISEVMAILLTAQGHNADTCGEILAEMVSSWQLSQTITDGWFYGDAESFDAQLTADKVLAHLKKFEGFEEQYQRAVQEAQA